MNLMNIQIQNKKNYSIKIEKWQIFIHTLS